VASDERIWKTLSGNLRAAIEEEGLGITKGGKEMGRQDLPTRYSNQSIIAWKSKT
jgi:hypothetical protein